MSEWIALGLVATGLYLFECVAWIAATAVACVRAPARRRWTCASGASLPGSERGGLIVADPFTIRGSLVVTRLWPLAISPHGLAGPVSFSDGGADDARYVPFSQVRSLEAVLDEIRINGERLVRLDSSAAAIDLVSRIRRVLGAAPGKREAEIRAILRETLDRRAAAAAWERFGELTSPLRWCAAGLAALIFVAAPAVLAVLGPYPSWMYLLAVLIVGTLATVVLYLRAHAALYRECTYDRWVHALSMAALPVAAIRGIDKLSRDALAPFHPVVVLPLLCGAETAAPLLRTLLVDVQRTAPPAADEEAGTAVADCVTWFRDLLTKEVTRACEREGLMLLEPPAAQPTMTTYCPRCHAQFGGDASRQCPDCAVGLEGFRPAASSKGEGRSAK